ncbi:MAG: sensor histidine kinase [Gemmatimonadetes bacterium]|nr:sensor histidine kinase [Gemmatimonadota bacterium]
MKSDRAPVRRESWLNFRSWRGWVAIFAACTVIGLVEGTQAHLGYAAAGKPLEWGRAFASTMPSWYVLGLLVPGIVWLAGRFPFEAGGWRLAVPVHGAASVLFAAVHLGLASYISDYLLRTDFPLGFTRNMSRLLGLYFVIELFFYWSILGGFYVRAYWRQLRERERQTTQLALKASRLETSLTRAHLETLRMQLNPHFLFNTLNAISVLAMKGEKQAVVRTLTLLSDLLRVSLESSEQVVPLREEIALLERYLEIEQTRFRDRLAVEFDVAPAALDAEVPTLLLQPLVENAIRHGIARTPGPGRIRICGRAEAGRLRLTVRDTGPGLHPDAQTTGNGIGLANTRARLEQLYGGDFALELENAPGGGAQASVELPLVPSGEEPLPEPARSAGSGA